MVRLVDKTPLLVPSKLQPIQNLASVGQNFTPVHSQVKLGENKRPWVKYAPSPSSASPTQSCLKRSADELDSSLEVNSS